MSAATIEPTTRKVVRDKVIDLLIDKGSLGMTWRDVSDTLRMHHGSSSGALSTLHKKGLVSRLSQTRNGSKVYVLPEWVLGRQTEAQGRGK